MPYLLPSAISLISISLLSGATCLCEVGAMDVLRLLLLFPTPSHLFTSNSKTSELQVLPQSWATFHCRLGGTRFRRYYIGKQGSRFLSSFNPIKTVYVLGGYIGAVIGSPPATRRLRDLNHPVLNFRFGFVKKGIWCKDSSKIKERVRSDPSNQFAFYSLIVNA